MEKHLLSGVSIYMLYPYGKAVGVNTELPMDNRLAIWKRLIRDVLNKSIKHWGYSIIG